MPPPRRDLPGDRRRQAAAGGLLHRRPAAGAALAALPAGDAGVVDLWSYGETGYHSLAAAVVRERYEREAMASAFRILGEGQLSLTKFLLRDRPPGRPARLPRHARARARAHAARDRPLRLLQPRRWTRSTTPGPTVNEGSKGVWLGLGDPVRELPREFRPRVAAAVRGHRRARLLRRLPGRRRPARYADDPGAAARLAAHPAFADWPLLVLTDEPRRAAASADELPVDDLHALRAGGRPPRRVERASCATTSCATPPIADRRAHEALVPGGALRAIPTTAATRDAPLARVLPRRRRRDGRLGERAPRPCLVIRPDSSALAIAAARPPRRSRRDRGRR